MQTQNAVELRWVFSVLRRRGGLILGCGILAAVIAFAVDLWLPPEYEASVTLLIKPAESADTSEYNQLIAGERLALTYSEMLTGQTILESAIAALNLAETPESLADRISAEPIAETQLIRLVVNDSSPDGAALLANTIAESLIDYIQSLQSKRYSASLQNLQDKINLSLESINETEAAIRTLNTRLIEDKTKLARLESQLNEYLSELRSIQQDQRELELYVTQLTDDIKIVDPAHVPEKQFLPPFAATATLFMANQNLVETYGRMLTGRTLLEAVIAELGLTETPDDLEKNLLTKTIFNTQLIQLTVFDDDATRALLIADAMTRTFVAQVQTLLAEPYQVSLDDLESQIGTKLDLITAIREEITSLNAASLDGETELDQLEILLSEYRTDYRLLQQDYEQLLLTTAQASDAVVISEPAVPPAIPVERRTIYMLLAGSIGLLLSSGISFLMAGVDDTIRTPEDVDKFIRLNVLGSIERFTKGEDPLVVAAQPRSPVSEDFRILATNLRYTSLDHLLRSILVTSPQPKEGKTTVAANLAAALSQKEYEVVVIDADLRLPRLHDVFGLNQNAGLTGSLLDGKVDGILQSTAIDGLRVLVSGKTPPNPVQVLGSMRMRNLIADLSDKADLIVLDSPPVQLSADASALATAVDGVLLVLQAGRSRTRTVLGTIESLRQVNAQLVGIVLNSVPVRKSRNYYYSSCLEDGYSGSRLWMNRWKKTFARFFVRLLRFVRGNRDA